MHEQTEIKIKQECFKVIDKYVTYSGVSPEEDKDKKLIIVDIIFKIFTKYNPPKELSTD